ncbi:MAG: oligosaccharide flippase family protein [Halioglobus sp.]|nr:oligosaccharide flippase family protein [Halioglobus sp.]
MTISGEREAPVITQSEKKSSGGLLAVAKVILGNGSYVALGFLANVVSANGLSPAQFGLVSIALATLNVLQEICGNGLDLGMVRLAAPHLEKNPGAAAAYYRAALQIKLLVNGGVALLLYVLAPQIALLVFENADMTPMLRWVSFGLMGACMYNYMLARVQAEERFSLYAVLRASNNIGKLLVLGGIWLLDIFTPDSVLGAWMGAFFIGYVLSLALGASRHSARAEGPYIGREYWAGIISFSKWVIASSFLFSLYSRIDMLILSRFVDAAEIGQYAAAWNITFIIDLMTYSVIIALLPQAVKIRHHSDFPDYLKKTFAICLLLAAGLTPLFLLSNWFFAVFFPAYTGSAGLFRILFVGAIITLLFHPLYLILYARNRVSRLAVINLFLVIFCTILGLSVIPTYGAEGAAWVTVTGRVFSSVLICYFVHLELQTIFSEDKVQAA